MTNPSPDPKSDWRRRWGGRLLVMEAGALLTVAVLALRVLPFRHAARLLIGRAGPADMPLPHNATPPASAVPWQVARAVGRASDLLPFPTLCLAQAIAARSMLARRGHATILHLSLQMGTPAGPAAHAWLTLAGVPVIGIGAPRGQVEIARFT